MKILFLIFLVIALSQVTKSKQVRMGTQCLYKLPPKPKSQCCGIDVTTNYRIFGGEKTDLQQYPWLGLIEYTTERPVVNGKPVSPLCGASLISSRHVITAAHCVTGIWNLNASAVRFGEYNRANPGVDCDGVHCITSLSIPIKTITVHTYYDKETLNNDIALIRLRKLAPYTDYIRPICLPVKDFTKTAPPNLELTVAGWGTYAQLWQNSAYRGFTSDVKQHTSLLYWPNKICSLVDTAGTLTPKKICAGGDGRDSCKGDSGGPLMYNRDGVYELVGVVSGGENYPCGQRGKPGYYTKVYDYMKWIKENLHN